MESEQKVLNLYSSLRDKLRILEDKDAIRDLRMQYAYALDARDIDALLDLFAEDAIWESSDIGCFTKAAFKEFVEKTVAAMPFWVHMYMNPLIEIINKTEAKGTWYHFEPQTMIVEGKEKATWLCFRYDEQYIKIKDKWKFRRVKVTIFFQTSFDKGWVKERTIMTHF